jgi:2-(1,2-epoxy-1,2-dihydrophenyl)acetyl-CoA isomerase
MLETVIYEVKQNVAKIILNRPKVMNAFDVQLHDDFYQALKKATEDQQIRSILISGSGKGFSAGADISTVTPQEGSSIDVGDYLRTNYNRTLLYMTQIEKPIISAIHGPAYGAGLGIALGSDFRIAASSSSYCLAFIKIGLIPDAGTTFFLPRIVGLSRALELAAMGNTIDAEEAYRIGLVNRIVGDDDLTNEAEVFAFKLATMPTKALGLLKKTMVQSFENSLATMLEEEARGQSVLGKSKDHLEGVQAFFEKRKPHFVGE